LIDFILGLGFGKKTLFSGRIFVPNLAQNQTTIMEKRQMEFMRTDLVKDLPVPNLQDLNDWPPIPLTCTEKDHFLLRLETPNTVEEDYITHRCIVPVETLRDSTSEYILLNIERR